MTNGFIQALLTSVSTPALSANALLFVVPLARLLPIEGKVDPRDRSPLRINGVPQQVLLHRLNASRGLPMGRKTKRKPLAKKTSTELRLEGDRAEVKAVQREHAAEAYAEQRAYEQGFMKRMKWNWRKVEKELEKRQMTWAGLALLAAEVGVEIAQRA